MSSTSFLQTQNKTTRRIHVLQNVIFHFLLHILVKRSDLDVHKIHLYSGKNCENSDLLKCEPPCFSLLHFAGVKSESSRDSIHKRFTGNVVQEECWKPQKREKTPPNPLSVGAPQKTFQSSRKGVYLSQTRIKAQRVFLQVFPKFASTGQNACNLRVSICGEGTDAGAGADRRCSRRAGPGAGAARGAATRATTRPPGAPSGERKSGTTTTETRPTQRSFTLSTQRVNSELNCPQALVVLASHHRWRYHLRSTFATICAHA